MYLQLLARLTDRRLKVDVELSALGSDKRNNQDIFKHCRQFERTFQTMLNEANVAFKIRAVVEGHLPEMLYKIPIEKRFNKNYTREICREADGYQPHLVSPERGIKRLVVEAMKLTEDHVHRFVDEIHIVLLETVKEAARNTMSMEISGGKIGSNVNYDYMRLRGFENAVIIAATQALEEWRMEAHKVASVMVQMECDYVTPSFFRELERQWQEEYALQQGGGETNGVSSPGDADYQQISPQGDQDSDDSDSMSPRESGGQFATKEQLDAARNGDWKAGWLEKKTGDSATLSSSPMDSWRWQKRWFVLSVESGVLFYYPSPDDVNKKQPKVAMNLKDCIVDDFQPEEGSSKKNTQRLEPDGSPVSLVIRIQHKNPNQKVAKQHQALFLRAADAADKYEWLAILRHSSGPKQQAQGQQKQQNAQQLQRAPTGTQRGGLMSHSDSRSEKGLFGRTVDKVSNQFSKLTGLGGSKMGDMIAAGSIQDLDQYYEKLGTFCGLYARMTYNRMAKTVPKAIVLCQVIRSRDRLLDQLFQYLSTRTEKEIEFMLQEDPAVARRRAAASQASKDISDSLEEVRKIVDVRNTQEHRKAEEQISVRTLLLAGAFPLVPADVVPSSTDPGRLYGEFTPNALAGAEAKNSLGKPRQKGDSSDSQKKAEPTSPRSEDKQAHASVKPRRAAPPPPPH